MAVLSLPTIVSSVTAAFKWTASNITWRNFVLLYALFNLKSVPFSWHIRIFYNLISRVRFQPHVYPDPALKAKNGPDGEDIHPIFAPASTMSHTSLFETDYNLHKSNSTYFSDLDIARTVLVTDLYTPGMELTKREMNREVDENGKQKYPGRMGIMLGSVYCSFKKEIKPYERYEMKSKIAAWDQKWVYVLTFFLRPEKRKGEEEKEGKTLLAVGVSKYVVKKGRLTVRPERVLRASGLLPPRPDGDEVEVAPTPAALQTPASGEAIETTESLDEPLLREVLTLTKDSDVNGAVLENNKKLQESSEQAGWNWERIEEERLRGLRVVEPFINVDTRLHEEV